MAILWPNQRQMLPIFFVVRQKPYNIAHRVTDYCKRRGHLLLDEPDWHPMANVFFSHSTHPLSR